jgi:PelA/Pel-15E family pectate lyase
MISAVSRPQDSTTGFEPMHLNRILIAASVLILSHSLVSAQSDLRQQATDAMRQAAEFYRNDVAAHGGYVYHYSLDLKQRWGEGVATKDQAWVQPPGTPTVGMAYLKAFEATGDRFYLDAATDAATAIVYGQLKSGGWTNSIDFDTSSSRVAEYRNGRGRGKNNSSLDDGQTQSAIRLLVQVDQALEFKNQPIHEASLIALDALLRAQYPNGGFPQVWTGPVDPQPVLKASYPDYDWRTEGRLKNYWDMYTLNDNVTGYVADTLIDAHKYYKDQRFLTALEKLGDFLLLAQMPEPQPGWAQQYSYEMKPIWARKFEPPGVSGDETQEVLDTLMKIARVTKNRKYLQPIPSAVAWLRRSMLPDGQLARYYELKTNRPLYMTRRGDQYTLTYDDSNLPTHYGWKTESRLEELGKRYAQLRPGKLPRNSTSTRQLVQQAKAAIETLDAQGRWHSTFDGQRMVGQLKLPIGTKYLSSQVFSDNLIALSDFLLDSKP